MAFKGGWGNVLVLNWHLMGKHRLLSADIKMKNLNQFCIIIFVENSL